MSHPALPDLPAAPPPLGRRTGRRVVALVTAALLMVLGLLTTAAPSASAAAPPGPVTAWGDGCCGILDVPASLATTGATAVDAGTYHGLALTPDGTVTAWGYNTEGQVDVPDSLADKTVTAISAGDYYSLALTSDGKITAWGFDGSDQTDIPDSLADKTVTAISAGDYHSLALTSDGKITAWGYNGEGESDVPDSLADKTVTAIAAGGYHSLALTSDGKITAWGYNGDGESDVPASLADETVIAIAAGGYHNLALTSDGRITAWGYDDYGQTDIPASLADKTVTAISAGEYHSLALSSDGKVTAWGYNYDGQTNVPASLNDGTVTAISAGYLLSTAITTGPAPFVTSSPASASVRLGATATFTAAATGTPAPTVQWQRADGTGDFVDIPDATNMTYASSTKAADQGARFRAVFTNETGTATSNVATLTVTNAPVTADLTVTTAYETEVPITLPGSDADGDDLTYKTTSPEHGTLKQTGTSSQLTYTPDDGYSGTDTFTYTANDGTSDSKSATVTINVTAKPNGVPTVNDLQVTASYEKTVEVPLSGSDPDNDDLTYATTDPEHGTLKQTGTGPELTYTPDDGFSGDDSFTYTANDGTVDSAPATVIITVAKKPNSAPVVNDLDVTAGYQKTVAVTLSGSDADDDPLTFTVGDPEHGTLEQTGTGPELIYTPEDGYSGPDEFVYTANDGTEESEAATVSIVVTEKPNAAPVVTNVAVTARFESATPVTLSGTDPDGDTLTYTVGDPAHGTLSGTAPELTYTPDPGYSGADSFTYTASDGALESQPASVSITVGVDPNRAPVVEDVPVTTAFETSLPVSLAGTDPDGDPLTYTTGTPAHGTLTGTGTQRTYTPAAGYSGPDSFTYTANDGKLDSTPGTVRITVGHRLNTAPTVTNLTVTAGFESPTPIVLRGTDADADTLTYTTTQPSHGTLTGIGLARTYVPADGYTGPDSFTYTANDGTLDSAPATVSITVGAQSCTPAEPKRELDVNVDQRDGDGSVPSPKFSTKKSGELLLAFVSVNGSTKGGQSVTKVTGGGLTWSLVQRDSTGAGSSEIWQAYAAQKLSNVRVTASLAQKGHTVTMTVAGFSGARSTVGASAHQAGLGSAPQVTLTPQASGSVVWGVGRVIGSRYDPKPVSGQKVVHDETFKSPSTGYWVQRTTGTTRAGTPVTVADKATAKAWGYSAVEIRGVCG
ncbi:Ig-like domain-containing protein [Microlunatus antarcticus]|uniref:Ig-like domain-containing protein n=1 Tax=Microlunatus antarcticus TaxID=53388 RepID=A0A7W5JRQ4_9ACTN|nr:Ig-like domain-containing protein [Microlunatus antarcticus]MBB3325126.1 hypothetical protein [Microlunatus antarcticus]